jgi:hypothetical protein
MPDDNPAPPQEPLTWTVRRAAAEAAKRKTARRVGLLRLKPFPRIELDEDGGQGS